MYLVISDGVRTGRAEREEDGESAEGNAGCGSVMVDGDVIGDCR